MKRKIIALTMAAAMLLTACSGKPAGEEPSGVYYEITGVDPEETVLVLDGNEIPAELYCYWAAFNCSALEYQLKMYHDYYGMYEEIFGDDGEIDWNAEFPSSKMTLNEYAKSMVEDTVFFYAAIENMAKKYGVELTEEDKAAIEEERLNMVDSLGGEEAFEDYLEETGLSRDNLERVMAATSLLDGLMEQAGQEGSDLYLPAENYGEYLRYTDYIVLFTGSSLSDEEKAAKRQTAEDLLAQLNAGGDKEELFVQLAGEHSEEARSEEQVGYFYAPGTMPDVFEEAAGALQPGEVSDIVETDNGLYIILGKSLEEGLEQYPEEKDELLQNYVVSLVNEYQDGIEVERRGTLTDMELGGFYQKYLEKMSERAVEDATNTLQGAESSPSAQS